MNFLRLIWVLIKAAWESATIFVAYARLAICMWLDGKEVR
jgi:phage shock protein PspC (stress-responsive transcriptional regulator)